MTSPLSPTDTDRPVSQPSLFDRPLRFDGADYTRARDDERLTVQYRRIFALMRDGHWRTLTEIEAATGDPQASISAQLRHMRKPRFGSHIVEKHYISDGLYEYRLIVNTRPVLSPAEGASSTSTGGSSDTGALSEDQAPVEEVRG